MPSANVELVMRTIAAMNAGDIDGAIAVLASDAEWQVAEEHPESRLCRGHDEIRSYFGEWRHQVNEMRYEPAEFFAQEDRVLAWGRVHGTGAGSDLNVEVPLAIGYTLREGKIVRGAEYLELDRALAALGLTPEARI